MEQQAKVRRVKSNEAIALATQGRWQDAVVLNREILEQHPEDVEALNRLGKALAETGRYGEARRALERSLQIAPSNSIARKNLERMAGLEDAPILPTGRRLAPQVFLEESGKSVTSDLVGVASTAVLGQVHHGDVLQTHIDGATVSVLTCTGQPLGRLEPKLAARLIKLLAGGNQYVVAVASVTHAGASVVVRETYQSALMHGVVSFPSTGRPMPTYAADLSLDDAPDFDTLPGWGPSADDGVAGELGEDEEPLGMKPQRSVRALHDEEVEDEEIRV